MSVSAALAGILLLAASARAADTSDTAYARGLTQMQQPDVLEKLATDHANDPSGNLYRAQLILTNWPSVSKVPSARAKAALDYVQALAAYLDSHPAHLDGLWALDHAKFIFAQLTPAIVNRIEYYGPGPRARAELQPYADLALRLTDAAATALKFTMDAAEKAPGSAGGSSENAPGSAGESSPAGHFDDQAYLAAYHARGDADYYGAYARYFAALAKAPGTAKAPASAEGPPEESAPLPAPSSDRAHLLAAAIKTLGQWADGDANSGVKYQSLLLRGKAEALAGDTNDALTDLAAAAAPDAPDWVQYQAHYQRVVVHLLAHDPAAAHTELAAFNNWIDTQPQIAGIAPKVSAELLAYRVATAAADTLPDADRPAARSKALALLGDVLTREPKFRDLVFEQLAAALPADADSAHLAPLPAVAYAWTRARDAQSLTGNAQASALTAALAAATPIANDRTVAPVESREATLIAAVADAQLGHLLDAVRLNLRFVTAAPTDPRAPQVIDLTISQLAALRQSHADPAAVNALTDQALALATDTLHLPQWLYARGTALEESGDLAAAARAYAAVPQSEPTYLDAQYRLIRVQVADLQSPAILPSTQPTAQSDARAAARSIESRIDTYINLVSAAGAATQKRLDPYLLDLRLVQATLALSPLDDPPSALAHLDALEKHAAASHQPLAPALQTALLRCRVEAYEQSHQIDQALSALAKLPPKDAPTLILAMARQTIDQVQSLETADPAQARQRAADAAQLLARLVALTPDADHAYAYRQLQADMLARAGHAADAQKLWLALQHDRPKDLLNFLGEARALFLAGHYAEAEDYFGRILPKVPIASDSYWECYLRILQSADRLNRPAAPIRQRLQDLRTSYGPKVGGAHFQAAYAQLFAKYHVE